MDVGNDGVNICGIVLKLGNSDTCVLNLLMNVGNDGVGVCNITTDIGNNYVGVDREFGLETDSSVSNYRTKVAGPTLKTWRILLRSNSQATIASLSSFEWKSREAVFRLPRLMTFL